jgi:hypothetical protein
VREGLGIRKVWLNLIPTITIPTCSIRKKVSASTQSPSTKYEERKKERESDNGSQFRSMN